MKDHLSTLTTDAPVIVNKKIYENDLARGMITTETYGDGLQIMHGLAFKKRKTHKESALEMKRAREAGCPVPEIAESKGCSTSTVYRLTRE